jgi:hypothetical protein
MPPSALQEAAEWSSAVRAAVQGKRGGEVASLLAACPLTAKKALLSQELLDICQGHELSEMVYFEAEAAQAASAAKKLRYLLCAFDAFQQFHTAPRPAPPVGWDTAILVTSIQRIRACSSTAGAMDVDDDDLDETAAADVNTAGSSANDVMGTMVRSWRRLFVTLRDLDPDYPDSKSRRRGALAVLNGLLGMLFLHNNTHQARIIIRSVEEMEEEAKSNPKAGVLGPCGHMVAEVVKYLYFRGRLLLYDRNPLAAFASFRDASALLPPAAECHCEEVRRNKLRIHFYWTIAGIAAGLEPPMECISCDAITAALADSFTLAISSGSDAAFDAALAYYAPLLKIRGVYALLVAHARPLTLLSRLRLVHAAIGRMPGGDNGRIPLQLLLQMGSVVDRDATEKPADSDGDDVVEVFPDGSRRRPRSVVDAVLAGASHLPAHRTERMELAAMVRVTIDPVDDLGLQVAQLIGAGKVRAYVAVDAQTIVLSRKEPFPAPAVPA